eukprot:scaffold31791_cov19-Tisochrysis_lutea.AAC.1
MAMMNKSAMQSRTARVRALLFYSSISGNASLFQHHRQMHHIDRVDCGRHRVDNGSRHGWPPYPCQDSFVRCACISILFWHVGLDFKRKWNESGCMLFAPVLAVDEYAEALSMPAQGSYQQVPAARSRAQVRVRAAGFTTVEVRMGCLVGAQAKPLPAVYISCLQYQAERLILFARCAP